MFVGHLAAGFAAKRFAPKTSLGTLLIAAQLPDVLWSIFLIAGVEHARIVPRITAASPLDLYDFPLSHSLLLDVVWAAFFAGAYFAFRRYARGASVVFAAVVSHWVLDFLSHRPDMPLAPGLQTKVGLGVWNSVPLTYLVEGGLWVAGIAVYAHVTSAKDGAGAYAFWPMIAALTAIWIGSIGGTPPPSIQLVAVGNLIVAGVFVWAYWIDRHRPAVRKFGLIEAGCGKSRGSRFHAG